MKCAFCGFADSKVIDSRPTDEGKSIRRRRECLNCQARFTTYEVMENLPIVVVKKDRTRQTFDRTKLASGLIRACTNRPISADTIDLITSDIEAVIQNSLEREITSEKIATLAMERLKAVDEVAYVRFASVTNRFSDVDSFFELLKDLKNSK